MNIWHDISPQAVAPENFTAAIEISKGSSNKYELDKQTGWLRLDRVLHTSTHYPQNYGFIPLTYGDDNDPLDVLVLCSEPILPMTLVQCYPIGVIKMIDNGKNDRGAAQAYLQRDGTLFFRVQAAGKQADGRKPGDGKRRGSQDHKRSHAALLPDFPKGKGRLP